MLLRIVIPHCLGALFANTSLKDNVAIIEHFNYIYIRRQNYRIIFYKIWQINVKLQPLSDRPEFIKKKRMNKQYHLDILL
jgi:hypothetical protein